VSRLARRIAGTGTAHARAMGAYHPWGTADTPQVMPLTRVVMTADGASVERLTPLVTANGAMIPASAPGQWGQVHAAGRP
jgi:hypothetical protein